MTVLRRSLILLTPFVLALPSRGGDPSPSTLATKPVDGKGLEKAVAPMEEPNLWHFTAGYQWRQMGSLHWDTGSLAAHSSLPWLVDRPSSHSTPGSGTLPTTGSGDHQYSDGFVNADGGTPFDGTTGFWGYNNASQLQGSNLSFHATAAGPQSSVTTAGSSSSLRQSSWSSDLNGSGWFANIESPVIFKTGCIRISLEAGYSYASSGSSHATAGIFNAEQHSSTSSSTSSTIAATDVYDASGIVVPSAPYAGTFAGPGATINNTPTSRTISSTGTSSGSSSSLSALFRSNVEENFHLNLHTVSLGPNFTGQWNHLRFGLGVGLGLNIADWSAQYDEVLLLRQNGGAARNFREFHADASGTKVLPGLYLEASVEYDITKWLGLFASGRYDWAGSLNEPVGPSHFNFDLGGWTVRGGLTISF